MPPTVPRPQRGTTGRSPLEQVVPVYLPEMAARVRVMIGIVVLLGGLAACSGGGEDDVVAAPTEADPAATTEVEPSDTPSEAASTTSASTDAETTTPADEIALCDGWPDGSPTLCPSVPFEGFDAEVWEDRLQAVVAEGNTGMRGLRRIDSDAPESLGDASVTFTEQCCDRSHACEPTSPNETLEADETVTIRGVEGRYCRKLVAYDVPFIDESYEWLDQHVEGFPYVLISIVSAGDDGPVDRDSLLETVARWGPAAG